MFVTAKYSAVFCFTAILLTYIGYRHIFSEHSVKTTKIIMPSAQEFVDAKVKDGKVVVFSKTWCPYCKKVKDTLNKVVKKDCLDIIELDKVDDSEAILEYLKKITGARSVPRVFIGGKSIGGNDDTQALASSGKMGPLLKDLGAAL